MRKAADLLESRARDLGRVITIEMGKPITAAIAEIRKCALVCRYYAEHAAGYLADEPVKTDAQESYIRYEPLGAVLAVMPWTLSVLAGLPLRRAGVDGGKRCAAQARLECPAMRARNRTTAAAMPASTMASSNAVDLI